MRSVRKKPNQILEADEIISKGISFQEELLFRVISIFYFVNVLSQSRWYNDVACYFAYRRNLRDPICPRARTYQVKVVGRESAALSSPKGCLQITAAGAASRRYVRDNFGF